MHVKLNNDQSVIKGMKIENLVVQLLQFKLCVGITDFDLTQSSPTCSRVTNYLLTYARDVNQSVQTRTT